MLVIFPETPSPLWTLTNKDLVTKVAHTRFGAILPLASNESPVDAIWMLAVYKSRLRKVNNLTISRRF